MKLLKNVLIKLTRGGFTDRVMFIDNVPEELLYELRYPVVCKGEGANQHWEPDMTKEKVMKLYEELHVSQTGDNGIVVDLDNIQSANRYLALKRYIDSVYTNRQAPAEPVINSTDPSKTFSPALSLDKIPRVVLPVLSPAESSDSVTGDTTASDGNVLDVEAIKKAAIAEYKQKKQDQMAKARDARKAPIGK